MKAVLRNILNKSCVVPIFFLMVSLELVSATPFEKPHLIAPEVILPSTSGLGGVYSTYHRTVNILFCNGAFKAIRCRIRNVAPTDADFVFK